MNHICNSHISLFLNKKINYMNEIHQLKALGRSTSLNCWYHSLCLQNSTHSSKLWLSSCLTLSCMIKSTLVERGTHRTVPRRRERSSRSHLYRRLSLYWVAHRSRAQQIKQPHSICCSREQTEHTLTHFHHRAPQKHNIHHTGGGTRFRTISFINWKP